jgi:hypothetical protein
MATGSLNPYFLYFPSIHPPSYLLHFYRAYPLARASSTSVCSHGVGHYVVGPCINGHLITPGPQPGVFIFFSFSL